MADQVIHRRGLGKSIAEGAAPKAFVPSVQKVPGAPGPRRKSISGRERSRKRGLK